jgi:multidrug resistance protein MdtO
MATVAQSMPERISPSRWFWKFLKEELAPYPGRTGTVARMVLAATLVMIICNSFRIPYGFQGAVYALLITRESPRATLLSARSILLATAVGVAYVLTSAYFVMSFPVFHFLWNIGSFFLAFYALTVITNYGAAVIFAIVISVTVPIWDRPLSAEANVEDTLRLALAAVVGVAVTAAVELAFRHIRSGDEIVLPIAERLDAVHTLLIRCAEGRPIDDTVKAAVSKLALLGTSHLRSALVRSDYSTGYKTQMGGVVALVGRLVDVAATLTELSTEASDVDRTRLRTLAAALASIRTDLINQRIPGSIKFQTGDEAASGVPLLLELENLVAFIPEVFTESAGMDPTLSPPEDRPRMYIVAPDALVNPEHFRFALKGCLAASCAYIIYNFVAWPGISTAVTTCLLTALSTIGASRQKQILRLAGAVVGGLIIGMGSQVFILPYMDSIGGFTILFALVTALGSWIMTSSPRLSYFGLQLAFSYYLIHLQEFAYQTSLTIARDRTVGVFLGLFTMWLVFDQLWGIPASVEMKKAFSNNLRLLAQLAREPLSEDIPAAVKRGFALRETINANFDQLRGLADGVLFEFGPRRMQDLASRDRIRRWQPQLRTLFLMRLGAIKYRLKFPGFELPEAMSLAQKTYDDRSARLLEEIADSVDRRAAPVNRMATDPVDLLGPVLQACTGEAQRVPKARLYSFVELLRGIDNLTSSLAKEIATEYDRPKAIG